MRLLLMLALLFSFSTSHAGRFKVPQEFMDGTLPSVGDDILGGTGSKNSPEMKRYIPIVDARAKASLGGRRFRFEKISVRRCPTMPSL